MPYIISAVFLLAILALCHFKPSAGRIFLGCFYLLMAVVVNGIFVLTAPQNYATYASGSFWPFYRHLALWAIELLTPLGLGIALVVYEVAVGLLLLARGRAVKIGLYGVILHIVAITPLGLIQLPWLGLALAAALLLRHDYQRSLPVLFTRNPAQQPQA